MSSLNSLKYVIEIHSYIISAIYERNTIPRTSTIYLRNVNIIIFENQSIHQMNRMKGKIIYHLNNAEKHI